MKEGSLKSHRIEVESPAMISSGHSELNIPNQQSLSKGLSSQEGPSVRKSGTSYGGRRQINILGKTSNGYNQLLENQKSNHHRVQSQPGQYRATKRWQLRYPKLTDQQAQDLLKTKLRSAKNGDINKIVVSLCQAKRIDYSILHEKYEARMEELKTKFPNSAKMRAQYEVYLKKRHAVIQTISNSLQENDLMVELMTNNGQQMYEFSSQKRKSLILQQNAGFRSVFSPDQSMDADENGQIFLTQPSTHESFNVKNYMTPKAYTRPTPSRLGKTGQQSNHLHTRLSTDPSSFAPKPQSQHMSRRRNQQLTGNKTQVMDHLQVKALDSSHVRVSQQITTQSSANHIGQGLKKVTKRTTDEVEKAKLQQQRLQNQLQSEIQSNSFIPQQTQRFIMSQLQKRLVGIKSQDSHHQFGRNSKLPNLKTQQSQAVQQSGGQAISPAPREDQTFITGGSNMSPSPIVMHRNTFKRQEVVQRNLLESAHKRISEFAEKQKKGVQKQKKVLEYQKYVQETTKQKFDHKHEFESKANDYYSNWQRNSRIKNDRSFRRNTQDIKNRLLKSAETDRNMSVFHNETFTRSAQKMTERKQSQVKVDNVNIESALKSIDYKRNQNAERASSARNFIVQSNNDRYLRWQRSIEVFKTKSELQENESLQVGIKKGMELTKRRVSVQKERDSQLGRKLEEKNEKITRHHSLMSNLTDRQRQQTIKLNRKFRDIEKRTDQRRDHLSFQSEFARQQNSSRLKDNQQNMEHNKQVLDCIKERIWRKHRKVQARRLRQQQQNAPPSTYEIYMHANASKMNSTQNQNQSFLMEGNGLSRQSATQNNLTNVNNKDTNDKQLTSAKTSAQQRRQISNNNLNVKNPLADFGLLQAYETSIMNGPAGAHTSHSASNARRKRGGQQLAKI